MESSSTCSCAAFSFSCSMTRVGALLKNLLFSSLPESVRCALLTLAIFRSSFSICADNRIPMSASRGSDKYATCVFKNCAILVSSAYLDLWLILEPST